MIIAGSRMTTYHVLLQSYIYFKLIQFFTDDVCVVAQFNFNNIMMCNVHCIIE